MNRKCKTCGIKKDISEFDTAAKYSNGKVYYRKECKVCKGTSSEDVLPWDVESPKENTDIDRILKSLTDLQYSTWKTSSRDHARPQMWRDIASGVALAIQHIKQIQKY